MSSDGSGETILADDFADGSLSEYRAVGRNYWGSNFGSVKLVEEPTPDGSDAYVQVEDHEDWGSSYVLLADEEFDWTGDYEFEFLLKSDNYPSNWERFMGTRIGWEGDSTEDHLTIQTIGRNGAPNALEFGGAHVESSTAHDVNWKPETWFWIRGEVRNSENVARAKAWEYGGSEPAEYQIEAQLDPGRSKVGEAFVLANGKGGDSMDIDVSVMRWGDLPGGGADVTEVSESATTLSIFPGVSENSGEGGDELNSALPDFYGQAVDDWFHGDFQTELEDSLEAATAKDRELEEFPGEKFRHYRFKNQVEVSFTTPDGESIDPDSVEVDYNEDTVDITLEKEKNKLRHDLVNETLFSGKDKMKATPRRRHLNTERTTINGVEAVRVSTIWGAFDPYVELMLEYVADNSLLALFTLLGTPQNGHLADFISTTPTIYTWLDFVVAADGTRLARVWDASRYPKHAGYLGDDKMDTSVFERGDDWQANEDLNDRFNEWTVEEQTHGVVPYESPHNAYLSLFDDDAVPGIDQGPHPVMYFGKDESGDLSAEEVKSLLPDDYLDPFES